jgi:two-component system, NarL family, nitrate/nitrite response regulator NarL
MIPADCDQSTRRSPTCSPAGTVLLLAKARLLRDLIGRILTDDGYVVLDEERLGGEALLDLPLSNLAWKADFVVVIYDGDETSRCLLNTVRHATSGKIVLLLRDSRLEEVCKEVLGAVDGVLNDEISADALLQALKVIQRGERVISRQLAPFFAKQSVPVYRGPRDVASLSPREKEIVQRLVLGESNKVIGHGLHITEATVKVHLKAILRKFSVQNRTQAAIWAINNGLD